jgi:hypothetical protein
MQIELTQPAGRRPGRHRRSVPQEHRFQMRVGTGTRCSDPVPASAIGRVASDVTAPESENCGGWVLPVPGGNGEEVFHGSS